MVRYKDSKGRIKTRKTIMTEFSMNEISAVDRPAQREAKATIAKRADDDDVIEKRLALTTPTEGHAHLINMVNHDGSEAMSGTTNYATGVNGQGHSHDWVRDDAGNIIVADAAGHTHGISVLVKGEGEDAEVSLSEPVPTGENVSPSVADNGTPTENDSTMTTKHEPAKKSEGESTVTQDQFDAMQKRAERAEKVADLTGSQRDHFNTLEKADQDAFLDLTTEDKDALVTKAQEANKVVFKAEDGTEYRESDDPRLVKQAQQLDEERKRRKQMEDEAKEARVSKRAAELSHLPGDDADRTALVEAIEALPAEKREAANRCLNAHDNGIGDAFKRVGARGGEGEDSAKDPIEAIAKGLMEKDNTLSYEQAYTKALDTEAGKQAYAKHAGLA